MSVRSFFIFFLVFRSFIYAEWELPPLDVGSASFLQLPQICCYDTNKAIAVWYQNDGGNNIIRAAQFDGTSWLTPVTLSLLSDNSDSPQICCFESGEAIVVWNASGLVVQAAHFDGATWSSPPINLATSSLAPAICGYDTNKAFVNWQNFSLSPASVIEVVHFDGTMWSSPTPISTPNSNPNNNQICCSSTGKAMAIWTLDVGGSNNYIEAAHFDGSMWLSPQMVSTAPQTVTSFPQVCCNDDDQATAVWARTNGSNIIVQASHFDGTQWSITPDDLSAPGQNGLSADVCCYDVNKAIAIWQRSNGTNTIIQSSRFDGTSWSTPADDLSATGQNASGGQICCYSDGRAQAIWGRSNGSNSIAQSSHFDGTSWSTPADDLSAPGQSAFSPRICCVGFDNAFALWTRSNGMGQTVVQSSFYQGILPPPPPPPPPSILPPENFSGTRVTNRFATQSEIFAQLTWSQSPSSGVVSYKIFRNGSPIATIPSSVTTFQNHNLNPNVTYTFSILSIDEAGNESTTVSINL